MTRDAKFEEGGEGAIALRAETKDDLPVIAALVQDAVLPITEIAWEAKSRRLALLINRFRWEDKAQAEAEKRPYERVRSLLVISDVTHVASMGIDRSDRDVVLSILDVTFEEAEDGAGRVTLTLAGDGALAADVECLDVDLRDVERPYRAPSGKVPHHPE
ncbi:hypothetical protein B6V73_17520 [Thioclava sp. JM3]|uniref:DUF2948 family protein n=1 Tax=unclassified Thioclava TaxID=2621713 RepID=UPI000B541B2E|nr:MULTISPECIES: DUF2948 family protein [unclassified Thioclava]OWY01070.1 hypothetical protein B6V75_15740 [Thioclava sp. F1Mire-8]OWY08722.1 hypothetical protein B6V74_12925 [Thioclava sp. F42-5]OWY13379.1 hypothetical protein B6V73_17520 [Thioclava sp. JM3]PWE49313.1 DUF2948 domain-containing protein [Thioclava sp. NG1]